MNTQYHYILDNVSELDNKIIEKYNLPSDVAEVIKIANGERAYVKLIDVQEGREEEPTSTIIFDYHNRRVITNLATIEAAATVLKNDVNEIRKNDLAWRAKLVMIFAQLIDYSKHYIRSIKDTEKAKQFINTHVYKEKQINLLKAEKDFNCNFELQFVPEEERKQQICQDFCSEILRLYVNLDLYESSGNIG